MKNTSKISKQFVIGVDGGGTKTEAVLADFSGKIIKKSKAGPSSLRNNGIKTSCDNVAKAIVGLFPVKSSVAVVSSFVGLPAFAEEYKSKKSEILKRINNGRGMKKIFSGKVTVGSDQFVAYRAGTDAKDGIVAICGTGSAIRGWNNGRDVVVDDIGWVSKGSGLWTGGRVMEAIVESLDGRGEKTSLNDLVFSRYKFRDINRLLKLVFQDSRAELPKLSIICCEAAESGDKVAQRILVQASGEIARSVRTAERRLDFIPDKQIPLVLVGGMFRCQFFYDSFIKELAGGGRFDIVRPDLPAVGAVKLALELIRTNGKD